LDGRYYNPFLSNVELLARPSARGGRRTVSRFFSLFFNQLRIINYELNVAFDLHALFENFTWMKFMFFDFDGYHGFLTKILLNFYYTGFFSQLHRAFFLCFANRPVILDSLKNKRNIKVFIMIRPI
jgi:hypothetical protein